MKPARPQPQPKAFDFKMPSNLNLKKSESLFSEHSVRTDGLKQPSVKASARFAQDHFNCDSHSQTQTATSFTDCSPEPQFRPFDDDCKPFTLLSFLDASSTQFSQEQPSSLEVAFQQFSKPQKSASVKSNLTLQSQRSCQLPTEDKALDQRKKQLTQSDRAHKSLDALPVIYADPVQPYYQNIERHFQTCKRNNKAKKNPLSNQNLDQNITKNERVALFDWLFGLFAQYRMKPRTIFLAANLFDRFLASNQIDRSELRLLGITCLFVATKYEDVYPPSLTKLSQHLKDAFSANDMLQMEARIIFSIDFNFHTTLMIDIAELAFKLQQIKNHRVIETTYDLLYTFLFHHYVDRFDLFKVAHFAIQLATELSEGGLRSSQTPKNLKAVDVWYFNRKFQKTVLLMEQEQVGTLFNFRRYLQAFYKAQHYA